MFKNLVILILTAVVLYLTNPSDADFKEYYSTKIEQMQEDAGWMDKVVLETKGLNAKLSVESENKVFFTIYTVNFMGSEERYLGIGTRFFDMKNLKEKSEKVKDGVKEGATKIKDKIEG